MEIDDSSCAHYNYVVTAQKPTGVSHAAVGSFTSANDVNLVIGFFTRLEIHTLGVEGLQGVLDVPIYGRVTAMELFRPKGYIKDVLFLLTEKYKFSIIEYDSDTGQLVTRANGDVSDRIGKPADNGQLGIVDPDARAIGLHLYDGMLKIIPLGDKAVVSEAFNVRLEELQVLDMTWLHGCSRPTLAVLYEDVKHARHVKTYEVQMSAKDLVEGSLVVQHVDAGAASLIPLPAPFGGLVVVGENALSYVAGDGGGPPVTAAINQTIITAWGRVDADGTRYLLGDHTGALHVMVVAHDGERVKGLKAEPIGRASMASVVRYLDNGVVYVGSRGGDSQLVRLSATPLNAATMGPGEPPNHVEVLETLPCLASIVDFCVVDPEKQGQGTVVTCSGFMRDGSLRVIRNGIGISEQASVELPGIKGVWSLRATAMDVHDKYLVLAFVGETRILAINEQDELDEAEVTGFDANAQTLYCGNTATNQLVQVTSTAVRLVDCFTLQLVGQWEPPAGYALNVAVGSATQVVVSAGQGHIVYLEVEEGGIKEVARCQLAAEVACLDISPVGDAPDRATLLAVGTWAQQLHLLALPSLTPLREEPLGGEVIPRSVLINSFEGVPYVMVGLGDGALHTWRLDATTGVLSERKRVVLGTKPVMLRALNTPPASSSGNGNGASGSASTSSSSSSSSASSVFAALDRPTIIYSSNKKLMYSNLNENEVNFMASFHSASFPNCLAVAKETALTIGTMDTIQRLHVRCVPLGEQPRRIAHQEATRTFGLLTQQEDTTSPEPAHFRVLDDTTFDVLASYPLGPTEMPCSLASTATLGGPPSGAAQADAAGPSGSGGAVQGPFFIVGTAFVKPEESEPTKGRILVLQYDNGKLSLVAEREVRGAAYTVLPFQGRVLAGVNTKVCLHRWVVRDDGSAELSPECSISGHIMALYLAARGDFILVGDLMRSVSLLMYKPGEGSLELRAIDYNSAWTTAVEMLDDDTYIVAENSCNLYVVRKNSDATTDEERNRLETVGEFHTGTMINRMRPGSLVMRLPDSELAGVPTLLYAGVDGALGIIASLPPALHAWLSRLQVALEGVVQGVGGLDHAQWRSFSNERRTSEARGFVDGDLIEAFLDLGPQDAARVVAALGPDESVEEVTRRVEELARALH